MKCQDMIENTPKDEDNPNARALVGMFVFMLVSCATLATLTKMDAGVYPTLGVFVLSAIFITLIATPKD